MTQRLVSQGMGLNCNAPRVGNVAHAPIRRGRGRSTLALTVRLDVEALDEQLQRESDAAERDHEGW